MERAQRRSAKTRIDKIIGNNIRSERILRDISREEMAGVIDLTVSHLGLIERGERGATPVTLQKLVKALDVSIDDLFTESERSKKLSLKQRKEADDTYFKKVSTLITHLQEKELESLTYTIKGLVRMRKNNEDDKIDAILDMQFTKKALIISQTC